MPILINYVWCHFHSSLVDLVDDNKSSREHKNTHQSVIMSICALSSQFWSLQKLAHRLTVLTQWLFYILSIIIWKRVTRSFCLVLSVEQSQWTPQKLFLKIQEPFGEPKGLYRLYRENQNTDGSEIILKVFAVVKDSTKYCACLKRKYTIFKRQ